MKLHAGIAAALLAAAAPALADQEALKPVTAIAGRSLQFDWPAIEIGVGSYEEGPTGVTVFHFPKGASAAVDVRGGAPGTVNTDALRLADPSAFVDAVVFSGGSSLGEETITAVQTGLKDRRAARGEPGGIAFATGAIIYDFRQHRLNEIYPDKKLARAALAASRPGVFPLGAQGAGRAAVQGGFLGCRAYSGQGGAFRQVGDLKIAAFTVVNALGAVVDREGNLVHCARHPAWRPDEKIADVLRRVGTGTIITPPGPASPTQNTTISLVVTNRKMSPAELHRLAVQVHSSMARAIQPFSTDADGDTLFAVSTQEIEALKDLPVGQINVMASELMWDAVLASVPEQVTPRTSADMRVAPERYSFGLGAEMEVGAENGRLTLLSHAPPFFDIPRDRKIPLKAISPTEFYVDGRHQTRLSFTLGPDGKATGAVVNPGRWAQAGRRVEAGR